MRLPRDILILLLLIYATFVVGFCMNLVAKANNDLAIRLYRALERENGNIFFCPFSITVAMTMLLRGTAGTTSSQIRQILGFKSANDFKYIHENMRSVLNMLTQKNESSALTMANALLSHKDFPLIESYKKDLRTVYNALVMDVDFERESLQATKIVNEWVWIETNNKIFKVINELDTSTVVILANVMYFRGTWLHEFDPGNTRTWRFLNHGQARHAKEVPMMFIKNDFLFMENEYLKAIDLPYDGRNVSMLIVLCKDSTGLSCLEWNIRSDLIPSLRQKMRETKIEVALPKFQIDSSKNFKEIFMDLGLNEIFSEDGNFQNMSFASRGLKVSEIVHKAMLDVDEEGSKAAAVTVAFMQKRCLDILPEFIVDRPFFFVIYNNRLDIILFMGKIDEL